MGRHSHRRTGLAVPDEHRSRNPLRGLYQRAAGRSANNQGSLGIIRAEALVDHCTWKGTHLRMLYGRNCSLTVTHCIFPDMFNPLDDTENPTSSSYNLDNIAEPMKIEHPVGDATANPQLVNNPNYVIGLPVGGIWRVYYNDFFGNKGTTTS
jgi:hypothetical protein